MCNKNCNCRERSEENNHGGNGVFDKACNRNPHCQKFSKVVARWQTVRHYEVRSHDSLVPVCLDGMDHRGLEDCIGDKCGHERRERRCE